MMNPPAEKKPVSGSETRIRSERPLNFRVNSAERAEIEMAASRAGLSVGGYVRARALSAPTTRAVRRAPVDRAALAQALAQLAKCGSNLNQIAYVLNCGGDAPDDLSAALEAFKDASRAVKRALGHRGDGA